MRGRLALLALTLTVWFGCEPVSTEALLREARTQLRRGNLLEARSAAERGERLCGDRRDLKVCWELRILKAEILIAQGDAGNGRAWLDFKLPPGPEFRNLLARQRMNQGYAGFLLSEYPAARKLLDEAAQLASEDPNDTLLAEVSLRRAAALARLGDKDNAEQDVRRALQISARRGDLYLQAAAYGNLGFLRLNATRYDEAIPLFEKALPLSEKAGARKFVATTLGNLGRCYYGLGDYEKAVRLMSSAVSLAGEIGDLEGKQIWLGNLADVYREQRDFNAAISHYRQALDLSRRLGMLYSTVHWLNNLTLTAVDQGALEAAERYSREALEQSGRVQSATPRIWALLGAAEVQRVKGALQAAAASYREVIAQASAFQEREAVWWAQSGLGNVHAAAGKNEAAENEFRQALATIEETRSRLARDEWKMSFHSGSARFHQEYVEFLMSRGQAERALEVAEWCRARVLAQKLGLQRTLLPVAPAFRFRATARRLGAVLVSFWLAPRRSFVWIVRPDKVEFRILPPEQELRRLVDAYKEAIQGLRDPLETANPSALRLYELVIAPFAGSVPANSNVIVVSDGCLHELNLETLPDERGRYWIEKAIIAIAPSLALLPRQQGERRMRRDRLLLIGNALPPTPEFRPLPDVDQEILNIRRQFAAPENVILTGTDAYPAVYRDVRPARFSLIHFSAHAVASRESPLDSAVILSQQGGNYKLYARDVVSVPLSARVVTISACRGAGARFYSGEGLVGFAWAFLQAGAQNVIAGLWDVNDSSTAALMADLYAALAKGSGPAPALRAAKLALIRGGGAWRKPFYWAPFQIYTRFCPFR